MRFLSISAANLDEFFMVRVAGLAGQVREGIATRSADGRTPEEQLEQVLMEVARLQDDQQKNHSELIERMRLEGIDILRNEGLNVKDKKWLEEHFMEAIFPVLTPLSIDPAHPFPFIPNLGFSMAFQLRHLREKEDMNALLRLPVTLKRFIELPEKSRKSRFIALENIRQPVHRQTLSRLRDQGFGHVPHHPRQRYRGRGRGRGSGAAVRERAQAPASRPGHQDRVRPTRCRGELREFVATELGVAANRISVLKAPLANQTRFSEIVSVPRDDLKFPPYNPRFPERIREHGGDCFAAIREKDIVVHPPYESFDVVVQFVRQASLDPEVVAIKQTLYRTSNGTGPIGACADRAPRKPGKSVTAAGGTERPVSTRRPTFAGRATWSVPGVQVVFGFIEIKTHAKMSLVVRREDGKLRSYVHLGTGQLPPGDGADLYRPLLLHHRSGNRAGPLAQCCSKLPDWLCEPTGDMQLAISAPSACATGCSNTSRRKSASRGPASRRRSG